MSIKIHADAVITLRDGFSGRAIESALAICRLDGEAASPVRKEGGVLVVTNSLPGQHTLSLSVAGFAAENVSFGTERTEFITLELQPDRSYPFAGVATGVSGSATLNGAPLAEARLLFAPSEPELKLAQDAASAGDSAVKLFIRQRTARFPAKYMLYDGKNSEPVTLLDAEGALAEPLRLTHKRGAAFHAVRECDTDKQGGFYAAFAQSGEYIFFAHDGKRWLAEKLSVPQAAETNTELAFGKAAK